MIFLLGKFQDWRARSDWRALKSWRPYFLIAAIGFLLYSQTLFFGLTYFDDNALIFDNRAILSEANNVGRIFSDDVFFSDSGSYYRPLLNISLMLDARLGQIFFDDAAAPFFFHFSNILLHLLATALVFYLLCRLSGKRVRPLILSLFFLVHPALAPAVAWIPGRNDLLLAILALSAFIFFLNFLERPRLKAYLGYLFLFFCALLTKESAISLPLLVIFYLWFVDKGKTLLHDRYLLVFGSAAIIFFWALMRHLALGTEQMRYLASLADIWHNLPALLIFAGKMILPFDLSVMPTLVDGRFVWGVLGLAGLLSLSLIFPPRRPARFWFGFFWIGIFLFPTFLNPDTAAGFLSHRLYLSFFGFLLILDEFEWTKPPILWRRRYFLIISAILAFLAVLTLFHSFSFRNRLIFWNRAVSDAPLSPLAQRNLGVMHYLDGDIDKAAGYYRQALKLNPNEPMAHNNLGVIYMNLEQYAQARAEFYAELEINPGYDKAINNLNYVQGYLQETNK